MKKLSVLTFLILSSVFAFAQNEYKSYGILYRNGTFIVELQYRINDPCSGSGKPSRFRYNVTGSSPSGFAYIVWKMDYYNCNNSVTEQTFNIEVGKLNEGLNENLDYSFAGYGLSAPFYSVKTSYYPDNAPSTVKALPKSEAAKSIVGSRKIDYGDELKLTVQGGALGVDAHWKWYADDCGRTFLREGETFVDSPKETRRYFVRAESLKDTTACISVTVQVDPLSKAPLGINGKLVVCRNQSTILTVDGGKLGKDAEWVWYQDNVNGGPLARGAAITVSLVKGATYFVRAEGPTNTTDYKSATVSVVEETLTDPVGISGSDVSCQGSLLLLDVRGGALSNYAQWVWYKDAVQSTNQIGKGKNITLTASKSTIYFVRGEGVCSFTQTVSLPVRVLTFSASPSLITQTTSSKKAQLSVNGGSLGDNAKWVWYKNSCGGSKVGEGLSIEVKRNKQANYYVRAESTCNTTGCASTTVNEQLRYGYTFFSFGVTTSFPSNGSNDAGQSLEDGVKKISQNPIATFTFGRLKAGGWYLRGKYTLDSKTPVADFYGSQLPTSSSADTYYAFSNQTRENRIGITGGILARLSRVFYLQLGGGYGKRELLWGVNEHANQNNSIQHTVWLNNKLGSYEGLELEASILIKIGFLNLNFGASRLSASKYNSANYIDAHAGLGFQF